MATLKTRCGLSSKAPRVRGGFTFVEAMMVIGILSIVMVFSVVFFRRSQIRSDLDMAKENVVQGFARAKMLSQTGQGDSGWGFYVPAGVLYKGSSYATRDPAHDEVYPMPSSVVVNGVLLEVAFTKLEGKASASGTIVLQGLDNQQRTVSITLYMGGDEYIGNSSSLGDPVTLCHKPGLHNQQTMTLPLAGWPNHQSHGDVLGVCVGGGGSVSCSDTISIETSGNIRAVQKMDMTVTTLAENLTYGAGPDIPVTMKFTENGGAQWKKLYNQEDDPTYAGRVETETNIQQNSLVALRMHGYFSQEGWTTYDSTGDTNSATEPEKALILRNGDLIPAFFDNTELKGVLQSYNLLSVDGLSVQFPGLPFNACAAVVITELSAVMAPPPESEDYTDTVLLLQFIPS
ncbi:MAG: hypothetical protein WCV62_03115 [Candidatus Peribacteraceae bacterium]|jgi:type II secretory pathway pseudopilin PulG